MSAPHAIDRTSCRRFLGLMAAFRKIPKAKGWPAAQRGKHVSNFNKHRKVTSNG